MNRFLKKRLHLFEFGDQPWLKGWLREVYMECLHFLFKKGGHYRHMHRPFCNWVQNSRSKIVLDLASGGGSPIDTILNAIHHENNESPKVILSDLYPNLKQFESLRKWHGDEKIDYLSTPVPAHHLTNPKARLRSICSALHHFRPVDAQQIVSDALINGDGIFILEPFQRNLRHLLMLFLSGPFAGMLMPFSSRPFRWRTFFVCTLVPIVPLMIQFDGIISVLRTYTFDEILDMISPSIREQFAIESGKHPYLGFCSSTYLYFYRKA